MREEDDEGHEPAKETLPAAVVRTEELFAGRRELWIDHNGERYKLRITRRGKLILQK